MSANPLNRLNTAERAVAKAVEQCRKEGPLHGRNPRVVAQVSRTGKWFINAVAALRRELDVAIDKQPSSVTS